MQAPHRLWSPAVVLVAAISALLPSASFALPQSEWNAPTSNTVRCALTAGNRAWEKSEPAVVTVKIENLTSKELNLKIIPEFFLKGDGEYSAPTDVVHDRPIAFQKTLIGKQGPAAMRPVELGLHLNARSTLTFEIDAAKTKWARTISSVWPSQPLSAVPSGQYSLRLEFDDAEGRTVRSNGITVTLQN
jgi:hypothetical protein